MSAPDTAAIPRRPLGKTGEQVSILCLGGFHLGVPPRPEAIRIVHTAIDAGVTFMDNAWEYNDGESERRMGKALAQDGYRQKAFLMTKDCAHDRRAEHSLRKLEESLRRLQTDYLDLWQIHEVVWPDDPDRIFAPGGGMEAMLAAKQAGKVRYIGFTGHKDPFVHLRMLEIAAQHQFRFDAVQMPLNVMDAHFRSFEQQVLPILQRDGIGVLAMKTLAGGAILRSRVATATECLHYALNLPTSTVITGMESMERLDQAVEAVRTFKPLEAEQVKALLARTAEAARSGRYERFKTGAVFDGTARNPQWLG